jgi:hypothetical protein
VLTHGFSQLPRARQRDSATQTPSLTRERLSQNEPRPRTGRHECQPPRRTGTEPAWPRVSSRNRPVIRSPGSWPPSCQEGTTNTPLARSIDHEGPRYAGSSFAIRLRRGYLRGARSDLTNSSSSLRMRRDLRASRLGVASVGAALKWGPDMGLKKAYWRRVLIEPTAMTASAPTLQRGPGLAENLDVTGMKQRQIDRRASRNRGCSSGSVSAIRP